MNKYHISLFLAAWLFVCGIVMAQTHDDAQQSHQTLEHEKAAFLDINNDPAAKSRMVDNTIVSRSPNDMPTSVVGKVLDADDRAIPRTTIMLTEADGTKHTTISDSFGNFRFEEVFGGQQVTLSAEAGKHSFSDLPVGVVGVAVVSWRASAK